MANEEPGSASVWHTTFDGVVLLAIQNEWFAAADGIFRQGQALFKPIAEELVADVVVDDERLHPELGAPVGGAVVHHRHKVSMALFDVD